MQKEEIPISDGLFTMLRRRGESFEDMLLRLDNQNRDKQLIARMLCITEKRWRELMEIYHPLRIYNSLKGDPAAMRDFLKRMDKRCDSRAEMARQLGFNRRKIYRIFKKYDFNGTLKK